MTRPALSVLPRSLFITLYPGATRVCSTKSRASQLGCRVPGVRGDKPGVPQEVGVGSRQGYSTQCAVRAVSH